MLGNSCVAERLAASQEGLSSMKLVKSRISQPENYRTPSSHYLFFGREKDVLINKLKDFLLNFIKNIEKTI
jgi:hypothetical protein